MPDSIAHEGPFLVCIPCPCTGCSGALLPGCGTDEADDPVYWFECPVCGAEWDHPSGARNLHCRCTPPIPPIPTPAPRPIPTLKTRPPKGPA